MVSKGDNSKDISIADLEREMEKSTPQMCVSLSHRSPSVQMYYALRTKFERSSDSWMQEFLDLDGLESLLDSLQQMTGKGFTSFSDAILQLDCISCIRVILNTNLGLDYMVQNTGSTRKLARALDSGTTLPKKQVFEMLSAICAYSCPGYHMVMDALEALKVDTHQTHKFSLIVNEMRTSETIAHRTAILTFINCLISCTTDLMERTRIRNELIGLDILDVLSYLRKEEIDKDLHLQLEMFHLRKHEDEESLASEYNLDMNCPQDLLDTITGRVFGSPRMVSFVNILQDLLSVELVHNKNSEKLWKTIDNLVHQVIHLCESESSDSFPSDLRNLNDQLNLNIKYVELYEPPLIPSPNWNTDKEEKSDVEKIDYNQNTLVENQEEESGDSGTCTDIEFIEKDKSTYDNVLEKVIRDSEKMIIEKKHTQKKNENQRKLKRNSIPQPNRKMKSFHWIKVNEETIVTRDNCIWLPPNESREFQPNFVHLEELFSDVHYKSSDLDEIALLNQSTRLNLNLFLSRLELGPEELVLGLQKSDINLLTLPVLRYLHKVLPDEEEVQMLVSYDGKREDFGLAEQFLLLLHGIPDYRLLLQGHLLKAEFSSCLCKLKNSLAAMVDSCKVILENPELKEFLQLILTAGNFLNHGEFTGNAAGFKLSSLHHLQDLKSKVPNKTFLHYLVQMAMDLDQTLLLFVVELLPLEKATSFSMEDLKNTMCRLGVQLRAFTKQLTNADPLVQNVFQPFLEYVKKDFEMIQCSNAELRVLINNMAEYLCEERSGFNLQHCLQMFHKFCKQIKKCQNENELFHKQHNLAKTKNEQLRLHLRHKKLTLEFGREAGASSSVLEEKHKVLEKILNELHRGNFKPVIRSELNTPDNEINCLDFSHISFVGSPMPMRPGSASEVLDEFVDTPVNQRPKILTSSEKNLNEHRKDLESFLATPKRPRSTLINPRFSTDSPLLRGQERTTPHKSHIRSRSDLAESVKVTEKWVRYEEICKQKIQLAPLALPESTCTLSTLNLENRGKFVTNYDLQRYESQAKIECQENMLSIHEGPIVKIPDHILPESKSTKKMEKRSSFGNFFQRISRAVLKPKNVYTTCQNQNPKDSILPGPRISELRVSEKENMPMKTRHASQKSQDKLFLKECKRFRKKPKENGVLSK
ncbi:hypothetical protein ScPMuIL_009915 [Solemya velum]